LGFLIAGNVFSEGSLLQFSDDCHFFDLYCWFHIGNAGFKPVWIPPFSSTEGVPGGILDGITDVIPPLFSAASRAVFESILDGVGKAPQRSGVAVLAVLM